MGGTVTVEALRGALEQSWSADTSSSAAWSEGNRAKGQCAVTACVVQDYLGGDILNSVATLPSGETVSHYLTSLTVGGLISPNGSSLLVQRFLSQRQRPRVFGLLANTACRLTT